MNSLRKWLYKPKKTDKSLLAQFYFADEELNTVASELDSFDSRKDPERCQALVAQLRGCQDRVLTIVQRMMGEAIPFARESRDFRVKFPDDVVQENLAGQLWFGAECLAAGSSIMNRETESSAMRPLARALTKNLDSLRHILRDQCLVNVNDYTERIKEGLTIFDKLFADFELKYVSAMVPVKTLEEYENIQAITVLFSETAIRAKSLGYITTDMIDEYDPALMFTIPRLAIICGLLLFPDGPLNPEAIPVKMSEMFRPFQTLLYKIRELLLTLTEPELLTLERALCSQEEPDFLCTPVTAHPPSSPSTTTTTTTAVQTDSVVLLGKRRLEGEGSCCSTYASLDHHPAPQETVCPDHSALQGPPTSCYCAPVEPPASCDCQCDCTPVEPPASPGCQQTPSRAKSTPGHLNKSDSNDSGLQSDGISSSDSHCTLSPSDSAQSGLSSPLQSPSCHQVAELCMEEAPEDHARCDARGVSRDPSYSGEQHPPEGSAGDSNPVTMAEEEEEEDDECFYTPSSGVSPLHQPQATSAVLILAGGSPAQPAVCSEQDSTQFSTPQTGCGSAVDMDTSPHCDEAFQKEQVICSCVEEGAVDMDTGSASFSGCDEVVTDAPPSARTSDASLTPCRSHNAAAFFDARSVTLADNDSESATCTMPVNCDNQCQKVNKAGNGEGGQSEEGGNEGASQSGSSREGSRTLCDRCTQTPHSVINNHQSLIHHHHRQHSSPSSASPGPQASPHRSLPLQDPGPCSKDAAPKRCPSPATQCPALASQAVTQVLGKTAKRQAVRPGAAKHKQCVSDSKGRLKQYHSNWSGHSCPSKARKQPADNSSASSGCEGSTSASECESDQDSCGSSETSSYNSESHDDEEIALAVQAAELANRNQARARFRSSSDMIHRLFVCISGVADQLQTNFAGDLRNILRVVFNLNCSEPVLVEDEKALRQQHRHRHRLRFFQLGADTSTPASLRNPPAWIPDDQSTMCMSCKTPFSFVRRRHHCRNCGKIFCGRCSSNAVSLPHFGHSKPVRVCNHCFVFQVNPFAMQAQI